MPSCWAMLITLGKPDLVGQADEGAVDRLRGGVDEADHAAAVALVVDRPGWSSRSWSLGKSMAHGDWPSMVS